MCGTDNKTYDTSCHFFATKCTLEGTKKGHKLHLDYIGPCKCKFLSLRYQTIQFKSQPSKLSSTVSTLILQSLAMVSLWAKEEPTCSFYMKLCWHRAIWGNVSHKSNPQGVHNWNLDLQLVCGTGHFVSNAGHHMHGIYPSLKILSDEHIVRDPALWSVWLL